MAITSIYAGTGYIGYELYLAKQYRVSKKFPTIQIYRTLDKQLNKSILLKNITKNDFANVKKMRHQQDSIFNTPIYRQELTQYKLQEQAKTNNFSGALGLFIFGLILGTATEKYERKNLV